MNEQQIRADEREQIAQMLRAWAGSTQRTDRTMSDYEHGYMRAFIKASRLVNGDDE